MFLQKFLSPIWTVVRRAFTGFTRFGNKFGWLKVGIVAVLLIIVVVTAASFLGGSKPAEEASSQLRTVELRTVAELSSDAAPLSVAGNVSSKSEASVRAEIGGQITRINSTLGAQVSAGQVIAEVSNASQRAAVAQAQGAVDAASSGGATSQTTLASAKQSATAALLSAYGSVDKAIHTDIDPMFSNPKSALPQFNVTSSDSQAKLDTENTRSSVTPILTRQQAKALSLSSSDDLISEITITQKELRAVRDFLDTVIRTLNSGIATNGVSDAAIDAYIATANAARSSVTASISALVAAQSAIETSSQSANTTSGASAAALTQAQAGLAAARANLEKTIVRAPISGTVNSFSLKVGDYLSPGQLAVTIANNGALEVVAYITDTDAREVSIGNTATIENNGATIKGVVTRVAPAIDPVTKKIEVRVGITEGAGNLVNGQSATVAIARNARTATNANTRITIPLSALKVGTDITTVFTVGDDKRLVPHTVELGTLLGDRVVIVSGITSDMQIVTDARGLQPGQEVLVK
jgi:RND family efflux transporter MFP subunit